ncbi:MAG: HAD family hydrolase [Eisenbergiella sp.]
MPPIITSARKRSQPGDDYNDIRMLRECGRGIAVENAISEVKEAADEICADNDRDGVAEWLERNILL